MRKYTLSVFLLALISLGIWQIGRFADRSDVYQELLRTPTSSFSDAKLEYLRKRIDRLQNADEICAIAAPVAKRAAAMDSLDLYWGLCAKVSEVPSSQACFSSVIAELVNQEIPNAATLISALPDHRLNVPWEAIEVDRICRMSNDTKLLFTFVYTATPADWDRLKGSFETLLMRDDIPDRLKTAIQNRYGDRRSVGGR